MPSDEDNFPANFVSRSQKSARLRPFGSTLASAGTCRGAAQFNPGLWGAIPSGFGRVRSTLSQLGNRRPREMLNGYSRLVSNRRQREASAEHSQPRKETNPE